MRTFITVLAALAATADERSLKQLLINGNNRFTAKMFSEVVRERPEQSVVASAFSVLPPLAQLALASAGQARDELLRAVGLRDDDTTKEVMFVLNNILRSVKGIILKLANRVYVQDNVALNWDFLNLSRNVFQSEVKSVDFKNNFKTAHDINLWVEDHTDHKIKNIVDPQSIDPSTSVLLVNALYFKGNWNQQFNALKTKDRDFHVLKDLTIKIPTMYQKGYFKYGESQELNAKLLEMFYEGNEASFLAVLPNEVDGLAALEHRLRDPAAAARAVDDMYVAEVEVYLPKFKIETTTDLKRVLQKIGVTKLFTPGEARLENLLMGPSDLSVGQAIQKAFIEVNEDGVAAGVANAFISMGSTAHGEDIPKVQLFRADRPFYIEIKVADSAASPYLPPRASLRLFTGAFVGCDPPRSAAAGGH